MRQIVLCFILGVSLGCSIPVRVQNTPDRPVPTAPMAQEVVQEDGTTLVNPQLGPFPVRSQYDEPPFPWMKALGQAVIGNWIGVGTTLLGGAAALCAEKQRRGKNQARAERNDLAMKPPDEAKIHLEALQKKE